MTTSVLIVSDRFPSSSGAGAESVLSALCSITSEIVDLVHFVILESPLISVNFDRVPKGYGSRVVFLRAERVPPVGMGIGAFTLPDGVVHPLDFKSYEKIFVFGDQNISRFASVQGHKIAWPDDPPHLVSEYKARCSLLPLASRLRSGLRSVAERWKQRELHRDLTQYEEIVHHAHHHAEEFRQATLRPVIYAPPLIPSMSAFTAIETGKAAVVRKGFIHIGHLGGAASLASIEMLIADRVKAFFEKSGEPLFLIGKADIPPVLKMKLEDAGYHLMGFVDDLESAMRSHRAVVVPGAYAVGSRTRILHSLSLGTPVIAHRSCLDGVPELHGCAAVAIFETPDDLVSALRKLTEMNASAQQQLSSAAMEFMADFVPRVEQSWKGLFAMTSRRG